MHVYIGRILARSMQLKTRAVLMYVLVRVGAPLGKSSCTIPFHGTILTMVGDVPLTYRSIHRYHTYQPKARRQPFLKPSGSTRVISNMHSEVSPVDDFLAM